MLRGFGLRIDNVNTKSIGTNFTALKSIKFKNGYKNRPDLQLKILNSIATNNELKNIYKAYDVNLIFRTYKDSGKVFSLLEAWCNKDLNTFKQIFNTGYNFTIDTSDKEALSLDESTENLTTKIQESKKKFKHYKNILDKIFYKENSVDETSKDLKSQVREKIQSMIYK